VTPSPEAPGREPVTPSQAPAAAPDPARPERYPRRVLVAVTGLSPQVITETVYALAVRREPPFRPTEVQVLTTAEGAERVRLSLLSEEPGWFRRLCRDYRLGGIRFRAEDVHALRGPGGEPLADIRTLEDNARAADLISEHIRALCADPHAALHVSVAGGRKTMGVYAAGALSLYGRAQDRLSHVLVAAPYESHPDFYYPTPGSHVIYTAPPDSRPLEARDAEVTLAEIPFVRLREGLPERLLLGRARFSEAVGAAQQGLGPPALDIDHRGRRVRAAGRIVPLAPAELAFLAWVVRRIERGAGPLRCPSDGVGERDYAREYLAEYRACLGPMGDDERTARRLAAGMDKSFFEQHKSKLNARLRRALGAAAAPYLVSALGRRPGLRYAPALPLAAIRFRAIEEEQEE